MAVNNVFVYGSLMCPNVLKILLNRVPTFCKAKVKGYHRYRIKDQVFPAVRPNLNTSKTNPVFVQGLLLQEITNEELVIFDEFEDEEYVRETVEIEVENSEQQSSIDTSHTRSAYMYIWKDGQDGLLYGSWSFEEHYLPNKEEYLKMCQRFIKEYHSKKTNKLSGS